MLAASDDCIKVLDLDGNLSFMSEGGYRVMEVSDFNQISGCPWPDFWHGVGNDEAQAAVAAAREGRSSRFQGAANTMAGTPRYWDVQVSPIFGRSGTVESILSVSRDITELKEAQEQQRLLALEISHRMKNTFAMVQAIASQTMRGAPEVEARMAGFAARLKALSEANDLLVRTDWTRANIVELVETVIHAHGAQARATWTGPDLQLSSKTTLALALALHELTTNATKYGALSNDTGRIAIEWSQADGQFRFIWSENGGPTVVAPSRTGFGTKMIERALASYFNGSANVAYAPAGIVCTVEAPVASLTES